MTALQSTNHNRQSPDDESIDLSIVVPIFNEEENLEPLVAELETALDTLNCSYEILFIDDGSTDRSLPVLERLREGRPNLRILCHSRNAGESAGLATGFAHARGEIVITMDGDLQMDPSDIPALLDALQPGVGAVCGVRREREDDLVRRLSSGIANGFRNLVTGDRIADAGCTYRAIRRRLLREAPVFNGMHRFLPSILRMQGYCVIEIPVNHRPRVHGTSKYGIGNRLFRGITDCLAMRWFKARCIIGERLKPE